MVLKSLLAVTAIASALHAAVAPAIHGADGWSIAVLDAHGTTLYADHASRALASASTLKLIVASAALGELSASYRFLTIVAAHGPVGTDGVLHGNLYLEGSGDPSLVRGDLEGAARMLAASGLRHIDGSVVADASADTPPEINPLWNPADADEDFQSPTSGLSLDEDTVEFHIIGATAGAPARVTHLPASAPVRVIGAVMTGASGETSDAGIASTSTPNTFRFSGSIGAGDELKSWLPVHGIARYVGATFERMLFARGITVGRPATTGRTPLDTQILWKHRSASLRSLVAFMLVHSNNHYAEQFMRRLGAITGAPDDVDGLAAERAFLRSRDIPTPGLHIVDGSGLAHANRVAAITLATILAQAQLRGGGEALLPLLPLGGKQGTLKHYDFTTALGRVRAKSGHIDGVDSLAGYVATRTRGRLIFAIILSGVPDSADAGLVQAVDALAAM